MISTSEIKRALICLIADYRETMTKDLEQALENLHDEIESDKEDE
tara:strand:- start:521 stop:655 length:135 start_codon:yes stop_codon:yes gene_type:complete